MLKLFTLAQSHVVHTLWKKEEGQTMAEYGVVLAVITVGIITALTLLSSTVRTKLGEVTGIINTSGSG